MNVQHSVSPSGDAAPIDLVRTQLPIEMEHAQAIATLSEHLGVPMRDVTPVYKEEFARLAAKARVTTYLIVLALRRTRSILRARNEPATVN